MDLKLILGVVIVVILLYIIWSYFFTSMEVLMSFQKGTELFSMSLDKVIDSSKNLIKYSPKMHDDFLKFENWLKSNPYVDDIFEFPFFTLKNKNGASLLSIKDIESTYVLGANDLERVFTQQEATALIKALQDKLQPKILAEWRPTPDDGFTPVKRINDLIYNIKTAWGL